VDGGVEHEDGYVSLVVGKDGFELPLDVVTEAVGIVATRGAGKSYASVVLVEEAHASGVQSVVIDPTGVYWGLRSAASGNRDGLPFYVFGGPHGDLPLEPGAGAFIADLVVDSGHSFVLDVSDLSKGKARVFVADFLERLYERKARARATLLVVLDEADEWAPQKIGKMSVESARCLGAVETLAKRGRSRGIGVVLISQRTQAINKDVLDLIETMFAMRISAPRSRATVKEWLDVKEADDDQGVLASLSGLPTGTAWVWSPVRGLLERVPIRRIKTFDSYATPKPGQERAEPARRVELDLDALGEQMRSTVERAKENDPKELRRRIRELEAAKPAVQEVPVEVRVEVPVEVPVVSDKDREMLEHAGKALAGITDQLANVEDVLDGIRKRMVPPKAIVDDFWRAESPLRPQIDRGSPSVTQPPAGVITGTKTMVQVGGNGDVRLKAGARRILEALAAHHPMRMTRAQIALHAKLKRTGGTFGSYWSSVKTAGLIHEGADGLTELTKAGLEYVGDAGVEPATPEQLLGMWRDRLKAGARTMLDVLVERYPNTVPRIELARAAGLEVSGGTFGTYLSTLKRAGLADVNSDHVRASDSLFTAERR
jgi:Helicase HerA, central domain